MSANQLVSIHVLPTASSGAEGFQIFLCLPLAFALWLDWHQQCQLFIIAAQNARRMAAMDFLSELEEFRIVGNINGFVGFWHRFHLPSGDFVYPPQHKSD